MPSPTDHRPVETVAVAGGGITGLAAALALARTQRFRVTLFEKVGPPWRSLLLRLDRRDNGRPVLPRGSSGRSVHPRLPRWPRPRGRARIPAVEGRILRPGTPCPFRHGDGFPAFPVSLPLVEASPRLGHPPDGPFGFARGAGRTFRAGMAPAAVRPEGDGEFLGSAAPEQARRCPGADSGLVHGRDDQKAVRRPVENERAGADGRRPGRLCPRHPSRRTRPSGSRRRNPPRRSDPIDLPAIRRLGNPRRDINTQI